MIKKNLETILKENNKASRTGIYGLDECRSSIEFSMKFEHKSLFQLLGEYLERANTDIFFNKNMVVACWEMINEL